MTKNNQSKKNILITGASGAIGSALALELSNKNTNLILLGRNIKHLELVKLNCEKKDATVSIFKLDLANINTLEEWLNNYPLESLDIVILNAGVSINRKFDGENHNDIRKLISINIESSICFANKLIPFFKKKKSGQIVFISSLAAYTALPVNPSYSASKAAIKSYAESLRIWLSKYNIKINLVLPGPVNSTMAHETTAPKLRLMHPHTAAKKIIKGIKKNKFIIQFPYFLSISIRLLNFLPLRIKAIILTMLGYNRYEK
ncbi:MULTISPECIES: SDR family NAD(P)-dependent oxidoreductase [unclassified Francisella]|uniref:SDR family NAD(P)-dependent oxidoreductase n=1 Tax=unclassified Francisella TaxID=2610885 RepID=UPI002E35BFED|nr:MULTISPECIES: SDR family NAD(P)-dependent oxidoreductase [unclassified Francisella]MED7820047.1 SDR family NAD(P)-dependent oxidoreductase [Francisella sp. 19S2-4]MED7830867.1 SDR family NAD(P)-dependent oxidoreductase [Francisella sp. 19S2-10]